MAQRVLITAGAAGIGRAIARAFLARGAAVFVCDVDQAALETFANEAPAPTTFKADLSSRAETEAMVKAALDALGGLDVLVNNVGVAGPTAPVEAVDPDEWDRTLRINLTAPFDVTRLAVPHLKRSTSGVIINLASAAGRFGFANRSPYAAAKWGVVGFTKTLAIELGAFGIRANAILPGPVAGPRIERVLQARAARNRVSLEEATSAELAQQSIKQFIAPDDIAELAVFLASDAAKTISGQALAIDGDKQAMA